MGRLDNFLDSVGGAIKNTAKTGAYLANPTHYDDIAQGVGRAGAFVVNHPGETAHIAGEVGKSFLKDQLKPQNLAMTAGLIALTIGTGGLAGPAAVAAEGAELGLEGGAAATETAAILKGGKTAVEAGEAAAETGQAVSRSKNFAQGMKAVGTGIKDAEGLGKIDALANAGTEAKGVLREALGMDRYSAVTQWRAEQGTKALDAGFPKAAARVISGKANPLMDERAVTELSQASLRAGRVQSMISKPGKVVKGVEIAADPVGYAEHKAMSSIDSKGGSASTYADPNEQTGDINQPTVPTVNQTSSGGQASSPYAGSGGSSGGSIPPSQPPGGSGPPLGTPPSGPTPPSGGSAPKKVGSPNVRKGQRTTAKQVAQQAAASGAQTQQPAQATAKSIVDEMQRRGGGGRSQQFWEGPRTQAYSGIQSNYDWRHLDPLRPITAYNNGKSLVQKWAKEQPAPQEGEGDLNAQGAPTDFSPLVPKSGEFALSTGQQPYGSLNPGQPQMTSLSSGPPVHAFGSPKALTQPKALATGQFNKDMIDVESTSPDDYGLDTRGQGYFNFENMGSGTADVGFQPHTNPMLQTKTRTKNRGILGV